MKSSEPFEHDEVLKHIKNIKSLRQEFEYIKSKYDKYASIFQNTFKEETYIAEKKESKRIEERNRVTVSAGEGIKLDLKDQGPKDEGPRDEGPKDRGPKDRDPTDERPELSASIPLPSCSELKKIYKKLCKILHPDISKFGDEGKFIQLQSSYENNDSLTVIELAVEKNVELDIDCSPYIKEWENKQKTLRDEIEHMKHSVEWAWCNAETDEEREKIRKWFKNKINTL